MIDSPSSECNIDLERSYINASYIDVKKIKVFLKTIKNNLSLCTFYNILTDNLFIFLGSFGRRLTIIHCYASSP